MTYFLGLPDNNKVDKEVMGRNSFGGSGERQLPGALGVVVTGVTATETNKRGSEHTHGLCYGGLSPPLLRDVAHHEELRNAACAAAATQYTTSVPLECKATGFHRPSSAHV